MVLGLLLTSFYWMPIVFLAKFTQQGSTQVHFLFPNFTELLYSPWRYGFLFQGHEGEMSVLIGYTQLLIISISIYLLLKNTLSKSLKRLLIFFLTISIIIFIMMTPITERLWENVLLLKYSQFPTRILVILSLCISIIAGIVVKKINKEWFFVILCFVTIFYTLLNWGNRRVIPIADDNYLRQAFILNPDVSSLEPTSPIWADLEKSKLRIKPKSNIEILKGHAEINEISRTPISHIYKIIAKSNVEIKENTLFFPGWIVTANNSQISFNYKNPKFPGIMTFNLDEGIHDVNVKFTDLPVIIFSKWLSGISVFGLLIFTFASKKSSS
jgi:hypothetical protein